VCPCGRRRWVPFMAHSAGSDTQCHPTIVGMMDEGLAWAIPRRVHIRPGEECPQRAEFVEAAWHDPQRARAEALKARLLYWRRREAALTEAILKVQSDGRRARTRYGWELEELYSNLDGVREALRALEGELAACGAKLPCPAFQPTTGSAGRPRRKRRRVVGDQGRGRRRRAVAAAG
jgi:hypothetical protein